MVTHPPTQRWGKKMKSESEKNRRSSTSRIVDITETLREEPRTNTTSGCGAGKRQGVW